MTDPETAPVETRVPVDVQRLMAVERAVAAVRTVILEQVLQRYGVTWSGYLALAAIGGDTGTVDHEPLAEQLGIALSTLSGIVAALERAGLVGREREPVQRRRVHVRLTDRGRRNLAAIHHEVAPLAAQLVDSLTGGADRTDQTAPEPDEVPAMVDRRVASPPPVQPWQLDRLRDLLPPAGPAAGHEPGA